MAVRPRKIPDSKITVVPANQASCADLQAIFGTRGQAAQCRCQRFKTRATDWDGKKAVPAAVRASQPREQTYCGDPTSRTTSGLVAYLAGEPVGWCAVEPRTAFVRLQKKPLVWASRAEDKTDEGIWALTCMITRAGFRRRGVTYALAHAAVDFARERGARTLEG
ncbi:MAG: GNAT family N-acetyltransferase [Anaerolineales bacterium]